MMNSQSRRIPAQRVEMKPPVLDPAPLAPVLPVRVACAKRHVYLVVDATGRAVSQEYWEKERAEAAMERIIRAARVVTRPCLCCRTPFLSEGPHNRMCPSCRNTSSDPMQPVRPYIVRGA